MLPEKTSSDVSLPLGLQQSIRDELFSPLILPYNKELLNEALKALAEREAFLLDSPSEHKDLLLFEVDRLKFYVKRYCRIRLAKIEAKILHIYQNDLSRLLSRAEFEFALSFYKATTKQFSDQFFRHVPRSYGENLLVAPEKGAERSALAPPPLADAPNENKAVFSHVVETVEGFGVGRGGLVVLKKGDVLLVPFKYVKQLVEKGRVVLK